MRRMRTSRSGRTGVCPRPLVKLSRGADMAMGGYNNEGGWRLMKIYGSSARGGKRGEGAAAKGVFKPRSLAHKALALLVGGVRQEIGWRPGAKSPL